MLADPIQVDMHPFWWLEKGAVKWALSEMYVDLFRELGPLKVRRQIAS
jgi:hypothetical protein